MAANAASISVSHFEPLQRLSVTGAAVDGSQKTGAAGPVAVRFDALGRSFDLELSPNSRLLGVAREIPGNPAMPYLGKLAGIENSWARIVISNGTAAGLIWDGNELFAIERPGDNVAGSDTAIIYRLADALIAPGSMTCGAGGSLTTGSAVYKSLGTELRDATVGMEWLGRGTR